MTIPKRIDAIASFIDNDNLVIDVGCDHALLDISLCQKYDNINCIACDINKNALEMAKKNIKKYNLENRIETILCDGIENINVKKNSIIVISGMGTSTIKHILNNEKVLFAKEIIIQSNNQVPELRWFMINNGYFINNEKVIFERGKYYVIISFKKGYKKYKKQEVLFGPILLNNKENNYEYFNYLLNIQKKIYQNIPFKKILLKMKCKIRIKKIMQITK